MNLKHLTVVCLLLTVALIDARSLRGQGRKANNGIGHVLKSIRRGVDINKRKGQVKEHSIIQWAKEIEEAVSFVILWLPRVTHYFTDL